MLLIRELTFSFQLTRKIISVEHLVSVYLLNCSVITFVLNHLDYCSFYIRDFNLLNIETTTISKSTSFLLVDTYIDLQPSLQKLHWFTVDKSFSKGSTLVLSFLSTACFLRRYFLKKKGFQLLT